MFRQQVFSQSVESITIKKGYDDLQGNPLNGMNARKIGNFSYDVGKSINKGKPL